MPRVLITGVAGFLGSRLAEWILQNVCGVMVEGIDDLTCGYVENVPPGVVLHRLTLGRGELRDSPAWGDWDAVFHFAAYAAEGLSPFIRQFNYRNNLVATAEIVNLCLERQVGRLVYTSSMAVYGRGVAPFAESDLCRPIDPYGIAKRACELDLAAAADQHGLDYCTIRPHNLYGPGQSLWQRYRNVLGLWMRARLENRPLTIFGDGTQMRAFSYVDDCLPCLWRAAIDPAAHRQTINLGGANPISIRDAAELLCDVTGGGELEYLEPRHEVREAWCTTFRSREILGFRDDTPLAAGLSEMWEWAQAAWRRFPDRRDSPEAFDLEVERGLYGYWREKLVPNS